MSELENFNLYGTDRIMFSDDWEEINTSLLQVYTKNMKVSKNFISKITKISDGSINKASKIQQGDKVYLSRYAHSTKPLHFDNNTEVSYRCVHLNHVLGVFREELMSLENLDIINGAVLVEPITSFKEGDIELLQKSTCTVGKVVKFGDGGFLKGWVKKHKPNFNIGDTVMFWNNVDTPITLEGKKYICINEYNILGVFKDSLDLSNLELLENRILVEEVHETKVGHIAVAEGNEGDFDEISFGKNEFIVKSLPKGNNNLGNLKVGKTVVIEDILLADVVFKGESIKTLEDIKDILCIKD